MEHIAMYKLSKTQPSLLPKVSNSLCCGNPNSAVYFYHNDHLGSASWITNSSGTPVQHLQYMPYGEPFVNERTSSYNERFTFTGKERDSETGYSYFGARFYDSDLMTGWLSVDPLADSIPYASPYTYCLNNPIKLKDPNGEIPLETIWDIGNVLYDFGAAVTNHIKGDHEAAKSNWCDLALDAAATLTPYVPAGSSKIAKVATSGKKLKQAQKNVKPKTISQLNIEVRKGKAPKNIKDLTKMMVNTIKIMFILRMVLLLIKMEHGKIKMIKEKYIN